MRLRMQLGRRCAPFASDRLYRRTDAPREIARCLRSAGLALAALGLAGCVTWRDSLTDFQPKEGPVCTQIHIMGTVYDYPPDRSTQVWIGQTPATNTAILPGNPATSTVITATVPEDAVTGAVCAKTPDALGIALKLYGQDITFPGVFTVDTRGGPAVPGITSFEASEPNLIAGETSTLSWVVQDSPNLTLSPGGTETNKTSAIVSPAVTTHYTLTAVNACLKRTATATINVTPNKITLGATTLVLERGQTLPVTVTIPSDGRTGFEISCTSKVGVSCQPVNEPAGSTQVTLPVVASSTAAFGTYAVTVKDASLDPQNPLQTTAPLSVVVGRLAGAFT